MLVGNLMNDFRTRARSTREKGRPKIKAIWCAWARVYSVDCASRNALHQRHVPGRSNRSLSAAANAHAAYPQLSVLLTSHCCAQSQCIHCLGVHAV